jgi:hypothetical protein
MKLLQRVLNRSRGLHFGQEYLCMHHEHFEQQLNVYLLDKGKIMKDITFDHAFVGYHPVVFALSIDLAEAHPNLEIIFSHEQLLPGHKPGRQVILAFLSLKKVYQLSMNSEFVFFYEAVFGKHRFISKFRQFIIGLHNHLFQRKEGNVFLKGNLYKQVQIAYSLPRKISLVTVGSKHLFNLFPTDLHGSVSKGYYVVSLRHSGNACAQVEAARNILLSNVDANIYREVYKMGKNHMQPMKEKHSFRFSSEMSPVFQLPVPQHALHCYELEMQSSFKAGIHKIMLFRIRNEFTVNTGYASLAHVHNVYATWRHKNQLSGNYLLR